MTGDLGERVPGRSSSAAPSTFRSALNVVSLGLGLYSISAASSSASAGFWLLAIHSPRSDPYQGFYHHAGEVSIVVSMVLALVVFVILHLGFVRLENSWNQSSPDEGKMLAVLPNLRRSAYVLLALTGLTAPILFFVKGRYEAAIGIFAVLSAMTAVAFLTAIAIPPLSLSTRRARLVIVAGVVAGVIGVSGEAIVTPLSEITPSWIDFGGYPLANWNLPFGSIVAISSALLFAAYRTAMKRSPHLSPPGRDEPRRNSSDSV